MSKSIETITITLRSDPKQVFDEDEYDSLYDAVWDTRIDTLKAVALETFAHLPVEVTITCE